MTTSEHISSPDAARTELDSTIQLLVQQAEKVLSTQGRLRSLLRANRLVVEGLELAEVLHRIVEAGLELVDSEYGALGVIGSDGTLEQFIHVGIPEDQVAAIGHLPRGHGLLGAVIEEALPIRLEHLTGDVRSAGFPDHHPRMDGFLGVPIRVRGEIFGNLYLTNPRSGSFSAEDEELVGVLAATAGIAIQNARLFDESQRRERWSAALADVSSALLSGDSDALPVVVEQVASLIDADLVCVVVEADAPGTLVVAAARGVASQSVRDRTYPAAGSLAGRALAAGEPVLVDGQDSGEMVEWQPALGPTFVVPLHAFGHSIGALSVSRGVGGRRFSNADLAMATDFGSQASVALELARGRLNREQLELIDDRSRIARDLHDHVIQRLFGAGLALQSIAGSLAPAEQSSLIDQVDVIDSAISQIRTIVFALSGTSRGPLPSIRDRLLGLVSESSPGMTNPARISFAGPVDLLVRGGLADDVEAVVRESLMNAAKHARAERCEVDVDVDDDEVRIRIDDDGVGYALGARASGVANLQARAAARGGSYSIAARPEGGTRVVWVAPIVEEPEE